jgi:hypothetical protein
MKGCVALLLASVASIASAATPATPGLTYLYSLNCTLGEALPVGEGPRGTRTVIPITGGTFSGPKMTGKCLDCPKDCNGNRSIGAG